MTPAQNPTPAPPATSDQALAPLDAATRARVRAQLIHAITLTENTLGPIPIFYKMLPQGFAGVQLFSDDFAADTPGVSLQPVQLSTGLHHYPTYTPQNVTELVDHHGAVCFYSWTPVRDDVERAAFARITVHAANAFPVTDLPAALLHVREHLHRHNLDAIVQSDGVEGYTLWLPLSDAPSYADIKLQLQTLIEQICTSHPDIFSREWRIAKRGDRAYLSALTNHPGLGTSLPYMPHPSPELSAAVPIPWDELHRTPPGSTTVDTFDAWLREHGDTFSQRVHEIGKQSLTQIAAPQRTLSIGGAAPHLDFSDLVMAASSGAHSHSHVPSPVLEVARKILSDGAWHTADDILAEAQHRGLLPSTTTRKHVYVDIYQYVARNLGIGNVPDIMQDAQTKAFRMNMPADPWPAVELTPWPMPVDPKHIATLVENMRTSAVGGDPAVFENAVCAGFAALGFLVEHIGGTGQPDGILTAPLGRDGYRVVIECKTAPSGNPVANPRPEEPAGFRSVFNADYALVIGPDFTNESSLNAELLAHQTALWTVDDFAKLLEAQVGPWEMRPAFAAGRAERACELLLWERDHGRRKRIAVIRDVITQTAWRVQNAFGAHIPPQNIPPLTRDTLAALADAELVARGVTSGAELLEFDAALNYALSLGTVRESTAAPDSYVAIVANG